jgi:hypothetical protein
VDTKLNKIELKTLQQFYTEKRNHFEGALYQYFEGIYHERDYKRNITISITILFVRGKREKKIIKQTF